ncbi:MAG: proprotein convertase P-domain-containing protein [Flavobacteriales bacterium]|nr:proprotein convertase P-domain-containing protein [Flavobacteriales bacterium]
MTAPNTPPGIQRIKELMTRAVVCSVLLLPLGVSAQNWSITEPTITTCGGVLFDSGGPGGSGYASNEDYTCTICPDGTDEFVSLNFLVFNLLAGGVGPEDHLVIHDGNSIMAPVLGDFTGQSLQGLAITGSPYNTSGCLTLRLRTNSTGGGNLVASIACTTPCLQPVAVLGAAADTLFLCPGDQVDLDGSASYPFPDRTLAIWRWSCGSAGVFESDGPAFSLSPTTGGVFPVHLQVVDDLGCPSEFVGPVIVLASGAPIFSGSSVPANACAGLEVDLMGQAFAEPWSTSLNHCAGLDPPGYLSDNLGIPNLFHIPISTGTPGTLVDSPAAIPSICVDMEHSFMGDLLISVTCPNGQSVVMHAQGGGGTDLGIPGPGAAIGSCAYYCWSASATNGTWASSNSGGSSLPPGDYQSVEPMSQLIGCPINGLWTLNILDLWAADDGYLCNWCLEGLPAMDSSIFALGPQLLPETGTWTGPNVTNGPAGSGSASITFGSTGPAEVVFSMEDSYGCVHDTLFLVQIVDFSTMDAGPDLTICTEPVQFDASINDWTGTSSCTYSLTLYELFGDGWNGGAQVTVLINGSATNYTISAFGVNELSFPIQVSTGHVVQLLYTAGAIWNNENSFAFFGPDGSQLYASGSGPATGLAFSTIAACSGSGTEWSFEWSPSTGVSDPTILNPTVFTAESGWYFLTVSALGQPFCQITDSVWVESQVNESMLLDQDPTTFTICGDVEGLDLYIWYLNNEPWDSTTTNCITNAPFGSWTVAGQSDGNCAVYGSGLFCPEITLQQNGGVLVTEPGFGPYVWTLDGVVIPGIVGPFLTPAVTGTYTVSTNAPLGCNASAELVVVSISTSVNERDPVVPALVLFPNPSDGSFTLGGAGFTGNQVALRMLDSTGRLVFSEQYSLVQGGFTEAVRVAVAPGSYWIHVSDGQVGHVLRSIIAP